MLTVSNGAHSDNVKHRKTLKPNRMRQLWFQTKPSFFYFWLFLYV